MTTISDEIIDSFRDRLDQHPIYQSVRSLDDLRCFMQHHVYSVWDFMSLIKFLQMKVAPADYPWSPVGSGAVRRFINELVLEEESDQGAEEGIFCSHYELYLTAMDEIGADASINKNFVAQASREGVAAALQNPKIPAPAAQFTAQTFNFIHSNQPHRVAAALALGREHIIPQMFRSILKRIGVTEQQAPIFHFYLKRHIHLDEDFHAPLSLQLLNELCEGSSQKVEEAIESAQQAVEARLQFWDGLLESIHAASKPR